MRTAIQRPHPQRADWMEFFLGKLSEGESEWMKDHLAACDFCWNVFLSLGGESLRQAVSPITKHPARSCPDDETLASGAEGSLAGSALASFERHLASCERCSDEVRMLRAVIDPGETDADDLRGDDGAESPSRAAEIWRWVCQGTLDLFRIERSGTLKTLRYMRHRRNRLERVLRFWREYGETLSPFRAFRDDSTPREHLHYHARIAQEMGPLYLGNAGDLSLHFALRELTTFLGRVSSPDIVRGMSQRQRYSLYDRWHEIYLALVRLQGMRTLGAPRRVQGAFAHHADWVLRTGTDR